MKKAFLSIVFGLLLFSPAVFAQPAYERANLWQKEIDALAEIDRRQTPPADAVLFVGSSSIRMWSGLRQDFPNVSVINRGFGGSHIEDVNHYFDRLVTPFRARKIFLYAGENDVAAGKTPERVAEDFRRFAALVREKSNGSRLYFISLKPSPARWNLKNNFERTNALIKAEIEKIKNAVFVDVWTPMLGAGGEPPVENYIADRLHINEKGYAVWREVLKKYVK